MSELTSDTLNETLPRKRTANWLATEIGKDPATTMKQFAQNATDIAYDVEKMQQALDFKNQNLSTRDIILKVDSKHISNHGRIIDGDLSMIIYAVSKVIELPLDTDLEWSGMDIVLKNYRDKAFFTLYSICVRNGANTCSASEYEDNFYFKHRKTHLRLNNYEIRNHITTIW